MSAARGRADQTKCLEQLRGLAGASAAYAAGDSEGQLLPAHPIADVNPLHDEGYFDYGGKTGSNNVWNGNRWGPNSPRTAPTRPLNSLLFGTPGETTDFSLFRCPRDDGLPERSSEGGGDVWDDQMARQPMFKSVGTSFWGNAYRAFGALGKGTARGFWSVGVLLRPTSRIPSAAQTVLYGEAIAWEQIARTGNASGPYFVLRGLPGWHANHRFNMSFCDGHAESIRMAWHVLTSGTDPMGPDGSALHVRGPDFRFDCRPDGLIADAPE